MANEDHIAHLREGVAAWNAWRHAHQDVAPDLHGGALRGLDLSGADLRGADLGEADLRGAILRGARLVGARLTGANLFKAVLDDAELDGAILTGTQFLNCAQLVAARNWQSARRDPSLDCGAPIPQD
jgi:uncharacterized protein YjbI with pentapeptide repeats